MIISQNSNDVYYAYTRGRFWRWDGSARVWKESHLLAQKFDKAKAAEKHLTPEAFLTGDEFIPMDDYELPQSMLTALRDAKPCKNAPIDPVEEDSSSGVPAPCICSTCTCGGCKEECFGNCHSCGYPVQECNSYQTEGEKHLHPAHSADVTEPVGNIPAAPRFDFSPLGELSGQAAEADQQFDLHYGAAQDEYLISCIYLARIHALTAKAGRYGGGTWTKWYESKGLSHGSVTKMVQNGEAFNSSTVDELKQLPNLTRKDLNLIARSGCADQVVAAAGDSQRVQDLLAQIKSKDAQLEAALADVQGLTEQNDHLQRSYDYANEAYKAADAQRKQAENERDKAQQRAKDAENALKKQPITGVVDKDEVKRQAEALSRNAVQEARQQAAEAQARLRQYQEDAEGLLAPAQACAQQAQFIADSVRAMYLNWFGSAVAADASLAQMGTPLYAVCGEIMSSLEEENTINPTAAGSEEDAEREALFE